MNRTEPPQPLACRAAEPEDSRAETVAPDGQPATRSDDALAEMDVIRLRAELTRLKIELEATRREHKLLLASLSWRLTRPLRLLNSLLSKRAGDHDRQPGASRLSREFSRADRRPRLAPFGKAGTTEEARLAQYAKDLATLRSDSTFDTEVYLPLDETRTGAIFDFLTRWILNHETRRRRDYIIRRPCAGFHPQIYAHAHEGIYETGLVNPLAHFIRSGRPEGPWRHDVITPVSPMRSPQSRGLPSAALHAHFHYPGLAEDFFHKLSRNDARCDLLLSTDESAKASALRKAAAQYRRGEVQLRVIPNRGRDVGAFLTGFADVIARYEIIGHFHGKRSEHGGGVLDPFFGDRWREFLWQNLIGDQHPMMDVVIASLAADEKLGIVFPEDPYLYHWDDNRTIAERLAARMGMLEPLPPFFDFPAGTMFWARTVALKPLFDLRLGWDDYPREPVPTDGTVLNAIERLLPFVARHAGYRFATTHVPGVTR
jgi:Rhamnan synthesis protein F